MDDTVMRFKFGGRMRALPDRKLEVLAVPFGSPSDLDKLNEYMTPDTDFMIRAGDVRPLLYFHGFLPDKKMSVRPGNLNIGNAVMDRIDDEGVWMRAELGTGRLADRVWDAAQNGTCRASTGTVNYLVRPVDMPEKHSYPMEITAWPIAELSLIDEGLSRHPVNDRAIALPLRAMFKAADLDFPKEFGEDSEDEDLPESNPKQEIGVPAMDEIKDAVKAALAERAAMRAKVEAELTAPAVMKEAVLGSDDPQQEHEFFWNMRHRNFQRRTLDETQAAEGLGLMPIGLVNQIAEQASAMSFAQMAGMPVYQTNLHSVVIPREAATPVLSDAVAEEGATSESADPAFGSVTATVLKHVDFVSVTEELLEDSTLLPAYFKRLAARKLALAENLDVVTAMMLDTTDAGVELATTDVVVKADLDAARIALLPSYRPGAGWFMHETTLEHIRAAATMIAAPYKFWEYGPQGNGNGTIMGYPVYTDPNWDTYLCATIVHFMCFANLKYGLAKVENPNIGITVNPYTTKGTGWVRFYLGSRFCIVVTQPLEAFSTIIQNAH